jgi:drug/metabolite transporter (DMT)-like permease
MMGLGALAIIFIQDVPSIIKYDSGARTAIIYAALLGIVGSAFATMLFYILIKRAGPIFAALVTYGIPIVAILWGVLAQENVTWIQFVCLGIILSGVFLANKN